MIAFPRFTIHSSLISCFYCTVLRKIRRTKPSLWALLRPLTSGNVQQRELKTQEGTKDKERGLKRGYFDQKIT